MKKNDVLTFFYNSIRDNRHIEPYLYHLLTSVKGNERANLHLLSVLYRLIGYTRDIIYGKGERRLSYMQVYMWYLFYPDLCLSSLQWFFYGKINLKTRKEGHPWGSWKDVKYLCQYVYEKSGNMYHPIILSTISLLVMQLRYDVISDAPSLAAKWVPREGKRFGWVNAIIAQAAYPKITKGGSEKSYRKAKMLLRKTVSTINRKLKTVQIDMCNGNWEDIEFKKVTSLTMQNNHASFEKNAPKKMNQYINQVKQCTSTINAARCTLYGLVRAALHSNSEIVEIQWKEYIRKIHSMNYIPIVNVSSVMEHNSSHDLYVAIGLGIIVSEKNKGVFKDRLMVFSGEAYWLNLHGLTFAEKVKLAYSKMGGLENVYGPFKKIVEAFMHLNYSQDEVEKLNILLVSSRIDYDKIRHIFQEASFRDIPKIAFWNLWDCSRMPCESENKNVVFLSGQNPIALNILSNNGKTKYEKTPWNQLLKLVDNDRYECLDIYIRKKFS